MGHTNVAICYVTSSILIYFFQYMVLRLMVLHLRNILGQFGNKFRQNGCFYAVNNAVLPNNQYRQTGKKSWQSSGGPTESN